MSKQADTFRRLHEGPEILVLPNAWDAASAAMMEDAGAKAVATSSAALAWAHGYADGDVLPIPTLLSALGEMSRVLKVPLTADIEGGYSDDLATLADTIKGVIDAGAVGINFEDGGRPRDLHARKIETAREVAVKSGVPLFVNARIDVYLRGLAEGAPALAETLERAELYRAAGADGIFVPGPTDETLLETLAREIALPLNVMGRGDMAPASKLQALGVRRLSSATAPFRAAYGALARAVETYLADGDPAALAEAGKGAPDLNKRFG
ncbi:isocitrate lyase/phosphoenolpyruvate mutase family protein [Phenylobacterium sp.]|uniref:isocitrate lyase/PEP mutase family protein n=1 Tax=Phenylobacterium sp. TaxID=1871053 RepID=UPI0027315F6D|nr:isocitrate lyase/phosphoenolpyruvate mutase family protein [Phenylobacterium sp.]MDP1600984.1 isocitrate lyase/phosphoenolpyruvate mutase family protein [Phenylobacterium sp.]MDP3593712.1 isocitrate lyase/phosphoenolpyruvate mutase family protein [Phenylobacterium sp.]